MNAATIASALAARAEDACRHYLPGGRKQGRFWIAGNIDGTPGRSLYVPKGAGVLLVPVPEDEHFFAIAKGACTDNYRDRQHRY